MAHCTLHAFGACAKPETLHGDATDADADSNGELRLLTRTSIIQILQAKNPPHLDESRPRACTDGVQDDSFGYHSGAVLLVSLRAIGCKRCVAFLPALGM